MIVSNDDRIANRYRIVREIGRGTIGKVLEVECSDTKRRCAIKLLAQPCLPDPETRERFLRSARLAQRVQHSTVATILDVGCNDRHGPYLVQELCAGQSLEQLQLFQRLPTESVCELGVQVLAALAAGGEVLLTHRNLKPSNIIIHQSKNETLTVKVTDFGLAHDTFAGSALQGRLDSSRRYAAPEVLRGQDQDTRSDLYSVGAILYELLSGQRFLSRVPQEEIERTVLSGPPEELSKLNPGLPETLVRAIHHALATRPDHRIGTAQEFARQLMPFLPIRSRAVESWQPVSIDPVLHLSAQLFGMEDDANPSLRLQRAPRPYQDGACPSQMLMRPVFPKSPKAPRLDSLHAAAFSKRSE